MRGLLSPRSLGFEPGSVLVGFVVEKVTLGTGFLLVLRLSPVNIIPPSFSILIHHLKDEQYVHQWQQFRDVSPHKNQSINGLKCRMNGGQKTWMPIARKITLIKENDI
jgi:hypothetical protein